MSAVGVNKNATSKQKCDKKKIARKWSKTTKTEENPKTAQPRKMQRNSKRRKPRKVNKSKENRRKVKKAETTKNYSGALGLTRTAEPETNMFRSSHSGMLEISAKGPWAQYFCGNMGEISQRR